MKSVILEKGTTVGNIVTYVTPQGDEPFWVINARTTKFEFMDGLPEKIEVRIIE